MRRRLILGVVLAASATLAVMLGWWTLSRASRNPRLRPLIAAAADLDARPFAVRLSGGFPYKPLAPALRGPAEWPKISRWKGFAAAAELEDAALKDPSPESLHALGVSQLYLRHATSAVETLEAALFRETQQSEVTMAIAKSADAVLLSDLAAAYFLRSQTAQHARDLMAAAECAARAKRIDAQDHEAAWNRAVIFEEIGVTDVARAAWSDFLALDSGSEWAVEARDHLRALTVPPLAQRWETERQQLLDAAGAGHVETVNVLVQRYPEQARTLVEEDLLGQWADARKAGDDRGAAEVLARARAIARAVGSISHDFLARDATAAVERNTAEALPFLIRGHSAYSAARKLYKSGQHAQAEPMLAAAASDLERAHSPLAYRAGAFDITSKNYLGRQADAIVQGRTLLQRLGAAASYPTLAGMLHWSCGLAAMDLGSLDEALGHHRAALDAFQHTEETSNLAGAVQGISSDYRAVGDLDNAWLYQIRSFQLASRYASFERRQVVVGGGGSTALRDGYVTVADEIQRGVLAEARDARQPIFICSALIRKAEALIALGAPREAREAIAEGLAVWLSVADSAIKSRLRVDLEMTRATLSESLSPRDRIAELNTAMEYVEKTNSHTRVAKVLLLRGRAYRDAGDEKSEERDLVAGISEAETQREKTNSDDSRLTFLNTAADLYDEAVGLHLRRGEDAAAFDLLERRRARWLLDRFAGADGAESTPVETGEVLRRQIPAGVAVVSYSVSQRLDAWVVTSHSVKHFVLPGSRDGVAGAIAAWRDAITSQAQAARQLELSTAVYDSLIKPIQPELAGVQALVIVPDRMLNAVPFSALADRRSGRYLVEDFAITIAPSANLYVHCLARSRTAPDSRTALIVANPAIAEDESLESLAGADTEGTAIAAMLPDASILRGTEATVEHFTEAAAKAALIHFAGHAVVNPLRPELSSLVLAPNREGGASRLYARDIYRMNLPHTRLVVLAACSSAGGHSDSDAPLSLATAFMAAGAPATIASLWPVDDAASSAFFRLVYLNIRGGMSAAQSLRAAQINSLRSGNIAEATWAAYQLAGATDM